VVALSIQARNTSDDLIDRASAYRAIGLFHGFDNLDGYPHHLTESELEAHYCKGSRYDLT